MLRTKSEKAVAIPHEWSDATLLASVLSSDERGWTELVRRYRALIYRCITKVTGRHAPLLGSVDVDEIFAEVLLNFLRDDMKKLRMYDPNRGTKLSSWIGMISINSAYDHLRSASRRPLLDRVDGVVDPGDEVRNPLETLIEKERWDSLNGLISEFSERDRTFLRLYYSEGLDAAIVAEKMSISLKTVYSKKHKIRASLKRRLADAMTSPIADLLGTRAPALMAA